VGNFLNLLGALDRLGGLFVIIVMREFAPLVCAIVMAGVAGTAMTADLGARKIREELDALMVLGVDPIKSLVVPRWRTTSARSWPRPSPRWPSSARRSTRRFRRSAT
jgi:ABC-type transporter Mla maintaining outer membrane lipid asymmetry permease subunit MlaE